EQAHSVAIIKHVMNKIRDIVAFLNPGQTPIIADQPLFTLAKQIQWHWPEWYGEDKFVIMFGGLHIEMAALRMIEKVLQDSGWTSALVEEGVASSGTAESFLSAASITKTRQVHQITACSLYKLIKAAYNDYSSEAPCKPEVINFEDWCEREKLESPQFQFCMELTILTLIHDNVHYAQWLPIHLRDVMAIEQQIYNWLGNFVVNKCGREFSALAIDQAHEQNNAVVKGDGVIGFTKDPSAHTKDIADPSSAEMIGTYYKRGRDQFRSFTEGLQSEDKCSFYQPIRKNMIPSSNMHQVPTIPRLFIYCQSRQCDLHKFFQHENQPVPTSLSDNGKLHTCPKSQLMEILEAEVTMPDTEPEADAIVIDGSALVNILPHTFDDSAREDVLPKLEPYYTKYKRTDIVFAVYQQSSLKSEARSKWGKGIKKRVTGTNKTPTNWWSFLRDNNKTELFHFLADKTAK
uniref:Uncharacterized protein n=1 Tax=Latimeria chalumnae TaxID=7897 RepID=H3ACQ8_LATCH